MLNINLVRKRKKSEWNWEIETNCFRTFCAPSFTTVHNRRSRMKEFFSNKIVNALHLHVELSQITRLRNFVLSQSRLTNDNIMALRNYRLHERLFLAALQKEHHYLYIRIFRTIVKITKLSHVICFIRPLLNAVNSSSLFITCEFEKCSSKIATISRSVIARERCAIADYRIFHSFENEISKVQILTKHFQ